VELLVEVKTNNKEWPNICNVALAKILFKGLVFLAYKTIGGDS
jgi:hypothetical protein